MLIVALVQHRLREMVRIIQGELELTGNQHRVIFEPSIPQGDDKPSLGMILTQCGAHTASMVHCYILGGHSAIKDASERAASASGVEVLNFVRGAGHPRLQQRPDFDNSSGQVTPT